MLMKRHFLSLQFHSKISFGRYLWENVIIFEKLSFVAAIFYHAAYLNACPEDISLELCFKKMWYVSSV